MKFYILHATTFCFLLFTRTHELLYIALLLSFREMLKNQTVRSCLPHLEEDMFEHAVKVYEDICIKKYGVKRFQEVIKETGVVAFRLGNASTCTQVR